MNRYLALLLTTMFAGWLVPQLRAAGDSAQSSVRFAVAGEDGRLLPCRIHLYDEGKKPHYAKDLPHFADHFVCPGTAELQLPLGRYSFEVERGPEYRRESGTFRLGNRERRQIELELRRLADLAADGWFSGDLHVHRPIEQIKLLMQAEDLHVAPVITWWNNNNSWQR